MSKSKAQLEAEYDGLDSTDDEGGQMDVTEKDEDHEYIIKIFALPTIFENGYIS